MKVVNTKSQRIGIFVDIQNLYYSAKHLYGAKVNFGKILEVAVDDRQLIRAIAYVIKADVAEEQNFFDALAGQGFEVKAKDLQVYYGGAKKGDWDVGIAMDTIRLADKLDTIILVSGDGDYQPLLSYLKSRGCRTEVIAFCRSASSKLIAESDSFIDLCEDEKKYLIKRGIDSTSVKSRTTRTKYKR